jgi:ABC-2 type transport system permease protein
MTGLLLAELRRYRSRRAVHATGMIIVAGIALAGFLVFINSSDAAPFRFSTLTDTLSELSLLLIILSLGLGATFIGAEWSAGTVTTLLTWEPRRMRVMVAKVVAAAVFVFVAVVAAQVVMGLAMLPAAMVRGSMEGVDASWFAETADVALRSSTIAAIAASIGFAIAAMARNTGAAIIVGFIYFTVLEGLIRAFRPNWARWLFGENAAVFLFGREVGGLPLHSQTRAIATLVAYAVILMLISITLFRRRDVT